MGSKAFGEQGPRIEHRGFAAGRDFHQLAAAAQVRVLVRLEAAEPGVLPRADRRLRSRREARDGDERAVDVGAGARPQRDGPRRRPGDQIVVLRAQEPVCRGPGHEAERGACGGQFDRGADSEVLERARLPTGTQQDPRAALAGEPGAAAVHWIDDVAPRAGRVAHRHLAVHALHDGAAGPSRADGRQGREQRRLGPGVDTEHLVAAGRAHDLVIRRAHRAGTDRGTDSATHAGERGRERPEVVAVGHARMLVP
jgi:hypothetical protein